MKIICKIISVLFVIPCFSYVDIFEDMAANFEGNKTIFVGLGATCGPAQLLRHCGLREAAFPFDWIVSLDNKGLVEMLEDDFLHFLDEDYLIPDSFLIKNASGASLIQVYYNCEFLHEGSFDSSEKYSTNIKKLKEKYQRRIDRFRALADYPGTIIFIRCYYGSGLTDINRYYKSSEILDISDENAIKIYKALKKRFPKLRFKLLIINAGEPGLDGIVVEKMLYNDILKIRSCLPIDSEMPTEYSRFFNQLIAR